MFFIYKIVKFIYKTYTIDYDYDDCHTEPIVFLHGWGGDKDSFSECRNLLRQYSTISISMPPQFLHSAHTSTVPLDMYDYVNIITGILDTHSIDRVYVVCHSFGFRVAMLMHYLHHNIDKLVVTGGAGLRRRKTFFQKLKSDHIALLLKDAKNTEYYYNLYASADYKMLSPIDKKTFKNVVNMDLTFCLNKLNMPIFLYWGRTDTETPYSMAKKIKKRTKYTILYKAKGGHFCYLENNFEFNNLCTKFLRS